ncbi:hypothetical protein PHJA_000565900 [Phtheirospermum japonicum]|uniref:Transmembrane protein n=1 Tax=Phtheirospermum japonicum TaxID=374723 RepID=A0A830BDK6_9LAMI|nr:hypothetical protein PHJA_000565900 [Phtheirospermum japonicum]
MAHLLTFTILSILYVTSADNRAHGLGHESPLALSPSAYTFFHPVDTQPPSTNSLCVSSDCSSSLSLAAAVQSSSPAHETASSGNRGLAAGGIVGIPLVFIFACLTTAGVYYVAIKRRANSRRANPDHQSKV